MHAADHRTLATICRPVRVPRFVYVVPVALGMLASTASAQQADPRDDAAFRFRSIYVSPRFEVRDLGVDTNVFNDGGDKVSDFTATLAPGVRVFVPVRRVTVDLTAEPEVVYYRKLESERSINVNLLGRVELNLHRFVLFVEDAAVNSRSRPNFEIDARARRVENTATAGVRVPLGPRLDARLSAGVTTTDFDGDAVFLGTRLADVLNRESESVRFALEYRPTVLTTLVLEGTGRRDRFASSPIRDSETFRVMPGVVFGERALISGSARVGYEQFKGLAAELPNFKGVVAEAQLAYRFLGAYQVGFAATRDLAYSFEPDQPYYVSTGFGVTFTRQLGSSFDAGAGVQRYTYRYEQLAATPRPAGSEQRVDDIDNLSLTFGYRLNQETRVALRVEYWERRSGRAGRGYNGFRVGTSVGYDF